MESERFDERKILAQVYHLIRQQPRPASDRHKSYSTALIVLVFCFSALMDRSVSWACQIRNWPADWQHLGLPSQATMSRRTRTVAFWHLLELLAEHLRALSCPTLVRKIDALPLPVNSCSKDREARWGQAAAGKARGYKLFAIWDQAVVPEVWTIGPMNGAEPEVARDLVPRLSGSGYLLGDSPHDSNPLHEISRDCGIQLLAPRKRARAGLGHRSHDPSRLRAIELLEGPSEFGRQLYARRGEIDRAFAHLVNIGPGLKGLPPWVRTPHRVVRWVAAKLLINGLCLLQDRHLRCR